MALLSDEFLESLSPQERGIVTLVNRLPHKPLSDVVLSIHNALYDFVPPVSDPHPFTGIPVNLKRFARQGGPTLPAFQYAIASRRGGAKRKRAATSSTAGMTPKHKIATRKLMIPKEKKIPTPRVKTSDIAFQGIMELLGVVYPRLEVPKPGNFDHLTQIAAKRRPSVNSSAYPSSWIAQLVNDMQYMANEGKVVDNLHNFLGSSRIPYLRDHQFKWEFSGELVKPKPDFHDGIQIRDIDRHVLADLKDIIVPSDNYLAPVFPNFFMELKGPTDSLWVALNQAVLDGTVGAQVVRNVQQYISDKKADSSPIDHSIEAQVETEPPLDNCALTICATISCFPPNMDIYCVHLPTEGDKTSVIAQIGSYPLVTSFLDGVTALRNLREWAQQQREDLIKQASSKASKG